MNKKTGLIRSMFGGAALLLWIAWTNKVDNFDCNSVDKQSVADVRFPPAYHPTPSPDQMELLLIPPVAKDSIQNPKHAALDAELRQLRDSGRKHALQSNSMKTAVEFIEKAARLRKECVAADTCSVAYECSAEQPVATKQMPCGRAERFGHEAALYDPMMTKVLSHNDMSEIIPDALLPKYLRLNLHENDRLHMTTYQRQWHEDGVLIIPGFLDDTIINDYMALRERLHLGSNPFPLDTGVAEHKEVANILASAKLGKVLIEIMGEELMLTFMLSGFSSSERGWHQDNYLNPEELNAHYAATWFALQDVDAKEGPFEFVPGSHKWPCLQRKKTTQFLDQSIDWEASHPKWCRFVEPYVNAAAEREIIKRIALRQRGPVTWLAKKGDLLIWHGCVYHRGSTPLVESPRAGLIGHYSGAKKRLKMGDIGNRASRNGRDGMLMLDPNGPVVTANDIA